MARVFTDGAEFQDLLLWDYTLSAYIETTIKRSGGASYRVAGGNKYLQKNILDISEFYLRAAYNFGSIEASNISDFLNWNDSTTNLGSIRVDGPSRFLKAYVGGTLVGTGTIAINTNTWYLVEVHLKLADAGGDLEVKVDGIIDIDFSGDTKPGSSTTVNRLFYGVVNIGGSTNPIYIDDLALNDTTGTVDNSWCGDGRVILLTPNDNGDVSQLVGQDADSTNNYLNVDDFPHDTDTTYNQSSTLNEYDLYNLTPCGLTEVTILRVIPEARARDTVAEGGLASLPISVSGAGVYEGENRSLLTSYTRILGSGGGSGYTLNPSTSLPWETSELDNLQVGFKVRS